MGRKHKVSITKVDFDTGIGEIIPSTQEAYHKDGFSHSTRKTEKEQLIKFKEILGKQIDKELVISQQFPTDNEVFIFILQYFISEKEYSRRDIDNMAKTILDTFINRFYRDDSQVKTLLVSKKIEKRVPENFAYIAVRELTSDRDIDALKISGLERSITLYQELKRRGIL
jgi:Holliday junction resolvase RusA-like endonuclease